MFKNIFQYPKYVGRALTFKDRIITFFFLFFQTTRQRAGGVCCAGTIGGPVLTRRTSGPPPVKSWPKQLRCPPVIICCSQVNPTGRRRGRLGGQESTGRRATACWRRVRCLWLPSVLPPTTAAVAVVTTVSSTARCPAATTITVDTTTTTTTITTGWWRPLTVARARRSVTTRPSVLPTPRWRRWTLASYGCQIQSPLHPPCRPCTSSVPKCWGYPGAWKKLPLLSQNPRRQTDPGQSRLAHYFH